MKKIFLIFTTLSLLTICYSQSDYLYLQYKDSKFMSTSSTSIPSIDYSSTYIPSALVVGTFLVVSSCRYERDRRIISISGIVTSVILFSVIEYRQTTNKRKR